MFKDKLRFWVFLTVFLGLIYRNIYGFSPPPEPCIEECSCKPVQSNRDFTAKEKQELKVCGSDGVTHESLCRLKCQSCSNNYTLYVRYDNATDIRWAFKFCNRTDELPIYWKKLRPPRTPKPTGTTTTKKPKKTKPTPPRPQGPTTTEAPETCDKVKQAQMKHAIKYATLKNLTNPIVMVHLGECEKSPKEKRSAEAYSDSSEVNSEKCKEICSCSTSHKHVCGTNGVNYSNKCELKCDACKTEKVINVLHRGPCRLRPFFKSDSDVFKAGKFMHRFM